MSSLFSVGCCLAALVALTLFEGATCVRLNGLGKASTTSLLTSSNEVQGLDDIKSWCTNQYNSKPFESRLDVQGCMNHAKKCLLTDTNGILAQLGNSNEECHLEGVDMPGGDLPGLQLDNIPDFETCHHQCALQGCPYRTYTDGPNQFFLSMVQSGDHFPIPADLDGKSCQQLCSECSSNGSSDSEVADGTCRCYSALRKCTAVTYDQERKMCYLKDNQFLRNRFEINLKMTSAKLDCRRTRYDSAGINYLNLEMQKEGVSEPFYEGPVVNAWEGADITRERYDDITGLCDDSSSTLINKIDCKQHSCYLFGSEVDGGTVEDLNSVGNARTCQERCLTNPDCQHFTYFKDSKKCSLKRGVSIDMVRDNGNAISGPATCRQFVFHWMQIYAWRKNMGVFQAATEIGEKFNINECKRFGKLRQPPTPAPSPCPPPRVVDTVEQPHAGGDMGDGTCNIDNILPHLSPPDWRVPGYCGYDESTPSWPVDSYFFQFLVEWIIIWFWPFITDAVEHKKAWAYTQTGLCVGTFKGSTVLEADPMDPKYGELYKDNCYYMPLNPELTYDVVSFRFPAVPGVDACITDSPWVCVARNVVEEGKPASTHFVVNPQVAECFGDAGKMSLVVLEKFLNAIQIRHGMGPKWDIVDPQAFGAGISYYQLVDNEVVNNQRNAPVTVKVSLLEHDEFYVPVDYALRMAVDTCPADESGGKLEPFGQKFRDWASKFNFLGCPGLELDKVLVFTGYALVGVRKENALDLEKAALFLDIRDIAFSGTVYAKFNLLEMTWGLIPDITLGEVNLSVVLAGGHTEDPKGRWLSPGFHIMVHLKMDTFENFVLTPLKELLTACGIPTGFLDNMINDPLQGDGGDVKLMMYHDHDKHPERVWTMSMHSTSHQIHFHFDNREDHPKYELVGLGPNNFETRYSSPAPSKLPFPVQSPLCPNAINEFTIVTGEGEIVCRRVENQALLTLIGGDLFHDFCPHEPSPWKCTLINRPTPSPSKNPPPPPPPDYNPGRITPKDPVMIRLREVEGIALASTVFWFNICWVYRIIATIIRTALTIATIGNQATVCARLGASFFASCTMTLGGPENLLADFTCGAVNAILFHMCEILYAYSMFYVRSIPRIILLLSTCA